MFVPPEWPTRLTITDADRYVYYVHLGAKVHRRHLIEQAFPSAGSISPFQPQYW